MSKKLTDEQRTSCEGVFAAAREALAGAKLDTLTAHVAENEAKVGRMLTASPIMDPAHYLAMFADGRMTEERLASQVDAHLLRAKVAAEALAEWRTSKAAA